METLSVKPDEYIIITFDPKDIDFEQLKSFVENVQKTSDKTVIAMSNKLTIKSAGRKQLAALRDRITKILDKA